VKRENERRLLALPFIPEDENLSREPLVGAFRFGIRLEYQRVPIVQSTMLMGMANPSTPLFTVWTGLDLPAGVWKIRLAKYGIPDD